MIIKDNNMINSITINGIIYNLKNNTDKVSLSCNSCDLADFCRKEVNFVKLCGKLNDNNYYKK